MGAGMSKEQKNKTKGKDKKGKGSGLDKDTKCQECGYSLVSATLGPSLNCTACGPYRGVIS